MGQSLEQLVREPSLASVNGKARLDGGPVDTFPIWWKSDLTEAVADPRTFDPATMIRDGSQVESLIAEKAAAEQAERDRLAAEEKARFDAAVEAEVQKRLAAQAAHE